MSTQARTPKTLAGRGAALASKGTHMIKDAIQRLTTPDPIKLEDDVARCRDALAAAEARCVSAVDAFDADDSDDTLAELEASRADAGRCADRVARSTRLLDAAKRAQAAADRAELEAKRARMASALTPAALDARRAPLAKREVEILLDLVETQADRWDLEVEIANERAAHDRVCELLGEPERNSPLPDVPPAGVAVEALKKLIGSVPLKDVRRARAEALLDVVAPYLRRLGARAAE